MNVCNVKKGDSDYPKCFSDINNAHDCIYYVGNLNLLYENVLAVIGKRDISERMRKIAYNLGAKLAQKGQVILNGLAIGCDAAAAKGALSEHGKVIGVLPCGLDNIYPASSKKIAEAIIENDGLLISEYPVGTAPAKYRFIERDKLQAAASKKIIVVDCDPQGGTMHTVDFAYHAHKPIACIQDKGVSLGYDTITSRYKGVSISDTSELIRFISKEKILPEQLSIWNWDANFTKVSVEKTTVK